VRAMARLTLSGVIQAFALPVTLVSSILYTASIPSFLKLEGIGILAYFCLVPLLLVLVYTPKWWGLFYGTIFGVIQIMLTNHWLGTFSLVSLQLITVVYLFLYAAFMTVVVGFFRRLGFRALLVFPFLWTVFDYLRSLGFIGYPWGFLGVSQYRFLPLIQIASVTGVWGITLVVVLANGVLAYMITVAADRRGIIRKLAVLPALFVLLFSGVLAFGGITISAEKRRAGDALPVRVALVQQNADPRKHDYSETFGVLKRETDKSMKFQPDLVVWSETAFVPNIRRWSEMDPARYPYARLVDEFLDYQKQLNVWLLTGNDDYELIELDAGETQRYEYNAAVLFDPAGERVETYRKMHLVPFTEYFPFKKTMPRLYEWLGSRDVYLWEPGTDRVVFEHPLVRFSTPICFEDGFPSDIRAFVRAGAGLIINISNDYWSLTEVEAQQHFANGLFRAIENSRPMLRASASGVTCGIDATGKVTGRLPFYEEGFLIADVGTGTRKLSVYTRLGDWLPLLSIGLLAIIYVVACIRKEKNGDIE
ncbi:MAG: apolipoprotein N-acyltransferase, partial [Spirochaetales bacterium]|nr:apolipoprotein N-acyltransferase [Spirochaetales bacterium]